MEDYGGFKNWPSRVMHNRLMSDEVYYKLLVSIMTLSETKEEAAAKLKATFLGDEFEDALIDSHSVHGDLLLNALQEVDWLDIVESNWELREETG